MTRYYNPYKLEDWHCAIRKINTFIYEAYKDIVLDLIADNKNLKIEVLNEEGLGLEALKMDTARIDVVLEFLDTYNDNFIEEQIKEKHWFTKCRNETFNDNDGNMVRNCFNKNNEIISYTKAILQSLSRYLNSSYFDSKLLHSGGLSCAMPNLIDAIFSSPEYDRLADGLDMVIEARFHKSQEAMKVKILKDIKNGKSQTLADQDNLLNDISKVKIDIENRLYDYLESVIGTREFENMQTAWDFVTNEDNQVFIFADNNIDSESHLFEDLTDGIVDKYDTNDQDLKDRYLTICKEIFDRLPNVSLVEFNELLETFNRELQGGYSRFNFEGALRNARSRMETIQTNYLTIINISRIINV
jgi:hypothetical protein